MERSIKIIDIFKEYSDLIQIQKERIELDRNEIISGNNSQRSKRKARINVSILKKILKDRTELALKAGVDPYTLCADSRDSRNQSKRSIVSE